jgi:hypothetical protein
LERRLEVEGITQGRAMTRDEAVTALRQMAERMEAARLPTAVPGIDATMGPMATLLDIEQSFPAAFRDADDSGGGIAFLRSWANILDCVPCDTCAYPPSWHPVELPGGHRCEHSREAPS